MIDTCFQLVLPRSHRDKVFGILTNGTETHGMNEIIRASVLLAKYIGSKIYIIRKGFSGLLEEGDDNLIEADWKTVSDINYYGGCIFGSGCSEALNSHNKRLEIAYKLIIKKITYLIVICGTNTMRLSDTLRNEWKELLDELVKTKRITKSQRKNKDTLYITYLPSRVDNFYGSDILTIGRDSALHRIIEIMDDIAHTAHSDERIYITEIWGIRSGYLALKAAICCEADYIFIPEYPPKIDWNYKLCDQITMERRKGEKRYTTIVMAEGAIDCNGKRITPEDVKKVICKNLQREAFITVLGNVQKGGPPSAFDRILANRLGVAAVLFLLNSTSDAGSSVITIDNNKTNAIPLIEFLKMTETLAEAYKNKNWEVALRLSGETFENLLKRYLLITSTKPGNSIRSHENYQLGVMCIGTPSCGMNGIIECFVKYCICRGNTVFGIQNGIEGLIYGNVKKLDWSEVSQLISIGGIVLGSRRTLPMYNFNEIAASLKKFNIQGLLMIGGFDAYHSCLQLTGQRSNYSEFRIPLVVIPATISNNVPGTEISIGSDTALNQITTLCNQMLETDLLNRLFIVEIMGGHCGYLTTMSGLAIGADATYIYEDKIKVEDLNNDINYFKVKVSQGARKLFVMNNEKASTNYDTEFLRRLFTEESDNIFKVTASVLGYMQHSGAPSPFDRNKGITMAAMCVDWLISQIKNNNNAMGVTKCNSPNSACVLGIFGRHYKFTPVAKLVEDANFEQKIPKNQWWMNLRPLLKILGNRGSSFPNGISIPRDCLVCEEDFKSKIT